MESCAAVRGHSGHMGPVEYREDGRVRSEPSAPGARKWGRNMERQPCSARCPVHARFSSVASAAIGLDAFMIGNGCDWNGERGQHWHTLGRLASISWLSTVISSSSAMDSDSWDAPRIGLVYATPIGADVALALACMARDPPARSHYYAGASP